MANTPEQQAQIDQWRTAQANMTGVPLLSDELGESQPERNYAVTYTFHVTAYGDETPQDAVRNYVNGVGYAFDEPVSIVEED